MRWIACAAALGIAVGMSGGAHAQESAPSTAQQSAPAAAQQSAPATAQQSAPQQSAPAPAQQGAPPTAQQGNTATAQRRDPATAEALFEDGRAAMQRSDYTTACSKFAESQRLDPAAGTLLNLADCEEHQGRLAEAWQHWREAIGAMPPGDDRLSIAKEREAAAEKRVPRLTLRLPPGAPAGVKVTRDGVELGPASLGTALPLNPGDHVVVVTTPGRETQRRLVAMVEGEVKELVLELGPVSIPATRHGAGGAAGPTARPAAEQPSDAAASSSATTRRTLGFVAGGIGVAGLGVALVTGLLLPGKQDAVDEHCDEQKLCDAEGLDAASAGQTLLGLNTAGWVVGLVGVGAGAVLILTSGGEDKPQVAVQSTALPGGAAFGVSGRF